MQLIGAGMPRTGTLTQKMALELLGLGPCYHMVDVLADLDQAALWERALRRFHGRATLQVKPVRWVMVWIRTSPVEAAKFDAQPGKSQSTFLRWAVFGPGRTVSGSVADLLR